MLLRALCTSLALAATAAAQSPFLVVATGDDLVGIGRVTRIEAVHVNSNGWWLVQAATDNPAVPSVVIREGLVWKQVGDPAGTPAGAVVASFDRWSEDLFGLILWSARLSDTPAGPTRAQAVYLESNLGLLTGTPTAWSTFDFPPGSMWTSFGEVRNAQLGGNFVLTGTVGVPGVPGRDPGFLAMGSQYGSVGVCCQVDLLALEGRPAPGQAGAIERIRTAPWTSRMGANGQHVYWSCDLEGPTTSDGCVYRCLLKSGTHTLLVREGAPSPVPGREWGPLEDLSLDATGTDWTLRSFLDPSDPASDGILVRTGAKLVQEGDVLPDIAPHAIDDLGRGRGVLDLAGHVLWYGHWNDPSTPSEALFLDRSMLVRVGTTTVGGQPLVDLDDGPHAFTMSTTGDYVLFTGTLAGGGEGAFVLNLGKIKGYCTPKKSSLGCLQFGSTSGSPSASAGSGFQLRAHNLLSQVPGLLFYGTTGPQAQPFLDGTLCVRPPLRRLPPSSSGGSAPPGSTCDGLLEADFNAWIAAGADPTLGAGTTVFAQFWVRDPGFSPPLDFGLTQAFEFTVAP